MKRCIVLIPIYSEVVSDNDFRTINNNINKIRDVADIEFIVPNKYQNSGKLKELWPDINIRLFNNWENSLRGYNRLLLDVKFYESYSQYEYMLICQTDALILKDGQFLQKFMDMGFDDYGAPWTSEDSGVEKPMLMIKKWYCVKPVYNFCKVRKVNVGNGGLCLRRTQAFINLLNRRRFFARVWVGNEDSFFSYYSQKAELCTSGDKHRDYELNVADWSVCDEFSAERNIKEKKDRVWGVHAWEKDYPQLSKELFG